jgi:hypothetical protein
MSAHISRLGEKDREDNASSNIFGPESLGRAVESSKTTVSPVFFWIRHLFVLAGWGRHCPSGWVSP